MSVFKDTDKVLDIVSILKDMYHLNIPNKEYKSFSTGISKNLKVQFNITDSISLMYEGMYVSTYFETSILNRARIFYNKQKESTFVLYVPNFSSTEVRPKDNLESTIISELPQRKDIESESFNFSLIYGIDTTDELNFLHDCIDKGIDYYFAHRDVFKEDIFNDLTLLKKEMLDIYEIMKSEEQ